MEKQTQRSLSYGEILCLTEMFGDELGQMKTESGKSPFGAEEEAEALFDYIQQYIEGCDTPKIRVQC